VGNETGPLSLARRLAVRVGRRWQAFRDRLPQRQGSEEPLRIGKFPDQVVRLAILFVIAGIGLVWARQHFVPETFGERGHYRAAAVDAAVQLPMSYAGRQLCFDCHDDQGEAVRASFHRTLSCEVCHGPALVHVDDSDELSPHIPKKRGEVCLYCHEYLSSRPTGFPQIVERVHNPMKPCTSCHDPHDPTPPETPESCAACHTQIARMKSISHHASLACETCHETEAMHREYPRGHLPRKPTQRSFCGGCHAVDAESPSQIPRVEMDTHGGTYTCWQCHYPHSPEA
jgi:hypothetical protein